MPSGERYFYDGSFKRFCKSVLTSYKPQPHRKYLIDIINKDEPINGWYFKQVDKTFDTKNYKIYE